MAWTFALLSLLSFMLLCATKSVALGFIAMLLSVGFMIASIFAILGARVSGNSRDEGRLLTPEELRAYREQAQAKRAATGQPVADAAPPPPVDTPPIDTPPVDVPQDAPPAGAPPTDPA